MALRVMLRNFLRKRLQWRLRWSPQIASQTFCLMLSSAQLTFNNFLSGRGNSEWVRDNLSAVQEYLSILRNLRREVQQVIEDHQEALRRLNDQENLVDALDALMPEIQEAEEEQKTQAASSSSGTPSQTQVLRTSLR